MLAQLLDHQRALAPSASAAARARGANGGGIDRFAQNMSDAGETVQQLALQGHPVPLNLLLLRKSFLALDGITRQLDPDFNAWLETLAYASGVFASEAVVRTWSTPFP
jgi:predicted unusual protein kinase regulating ubiquinone biosynthesis (AarF/ABC1/UbiB family)